MGKKKTGFGNIKKGAFTAYCRRRGFSGPNSDCIAYAKKQGGHPAKMAVFAQNAKRGFKKAP